MFGWTPGIGDPTIYGWVTVAAYAVAALLCWLASRHSVDAAERRFWLVLTAIMAFLCVNKQLDLQTLFTHIGRAQAKAQGWYDSRREYQATGIIGLALVSITLVAIAMRRLKDAPVAVRGALVGMVLLVFFILVRASSIEKMDYLIGRSILGVRVNQVLELGGIALVSAFALLACGIGIRRPR